MSRYVHDAGPGGVPSALSTGTEGDCTATSPAAAATRSRGDLVQTTFLHLHRARNDFRQGMPLRPWLFTIAANVRREHWRKRARRPETPIDLPSRSPPQRPSVAPKATTATQRVVQRAIDGLPESQREVILLRWYAELSFAEIARVLGIDPRGPSACAPHPRESARCGARLGGSMADPPHAGPARPARAAARESPPGSKATRPQRAPSPTPRRPVRAHRRANDRPPPRPPTTRLRALPTPASDRGRLGGDRGCGQP